MAVRVTMVKFTRSAPLLPNSPEYSARLKLLYPVESYHASTRLMPEASVLRSADERSRIVARSHRTARTSLNPIGAKGVIQTIGPSREIMRSARFVSSDTRSFQKHRPFACQ